MADRPAPVMRPTYTAAEVRKVLRAAVVEAGGVPALAARLNMDDKTIRMCHGDNSRDLSESVALALGLRVVKLYVPKGTPL